MTALLTGGGLFIGLLVGLAAPHARRGHRRSPQAASTRQILLPFTGTTLSRRALEAAIRLAKLDGATLLPAFLATVPLGRRRSPPGPSGPTPPPDPRQPQPKGPDPRTRTARHPRHPPHRHQGPL